MLLLVPITWPSERRLAQLLRSTPDVDPAVAEAMIAIRRHRFVRWRSRWHAYEDRSLPTGAGTSISQPTYVARVISLARLSANDRVLEIGTGSGYTAAVLGRLAREIVSVECVRELAASARRRLSSVPNVTVILGDGCGATQGEFDAILVMAGAPSVPASCCARLRDGGRLIVPVGERRSDAVGATMMRVTRRGSDLVREELMAGDWNLLSGADGWEDGGG
jgi:protein-L-isoaspartate(D-aspartate) O-methyltransferase